MALIIDLLLLAIICACIYSGYKKGFISSVVNLCSFIVSFLCGWYFSPPLAEYLKDKLFFDKIRDSIAEAIGKFIGDGIGNIDISSLFNVKPEAFLKFTQRFGIDISELENYYVSSGMSGESAEATRDLAGFIASPITDLIASVCAFAIIFFGTTLLLKPLAAILNVIFRLPVLKFANRFFGVILGVGCGLLYAWITCCILEKLIPALETLYPEWISISILNSTIIYNLLNGVNIMDTVISVLFK